MNPQLQALPPHPFARLRQLLAACRPPAGMELIDLSVGEPSAAPPPAALQALAASLAGLGRYPRPADAAPLHQAIARALQRRHGVDLHPESQVLASCGSREALFSIAQAAAGGRAGALVLIPNPFYAIYEGAAILAGARPLVLRDAADGLPDLAALGADDWRHLALMYLCTPSNPGGAVLGMAALRRAVQLAQRHDFVIACDECYGDIYGDAPPPGILQACIAEGLPGFDRCLAFGSLSKRSGLPGLRSGYVAGDAAIIAQFARWRVYQGAAMAPPSRAASIAAWDDDSAAQRGRALYNAALAAAQPLLDGPWDCPMPDGGFYLWPQTGGDDELLCKLLYERAAVLCLPGSYLARDDARGANPGRGRLRLAMVQPPQLCAAAARRILAALP